MARGRRSDLDGLAGARGLFPVTSARPLGGQTHPRSPAGGSTHNTSPRLRGGAGEEHRGDREVPAPLPRATRATAKPRPPGKVKTNPAFPDIRTRHSDILGELAKENAELLRTKGWRNLVKERRGRSALNPNVGTLPHEAAATLDFLRRHGAPVHTSDSPKTPAELQEAADRGPHPSAQLHQEFLWEEVVDMCKRHHTMVLPLSVAKTIEGARASPPGVIPQKDRRPRTVCDLTDAASPEPGVNPSTVPLAPMEAMQFGQALRRLLFQIHRADRRWGPVYIAKDDVSDGFYNVCVNVNGVKKFGVILPTPEGQEPLILFFLALPMGWVSSPPWFCAASETVADLANARIKANWKPPAHRLDTVAETPTPTTRPQSQAGPPPRIRARNKGPLGAVDVYVDDFLILAQGGKRRRCRLRRVLFHCVDEVFWPPDENDDEWKKDPNSVKKLLKGDGAMETVKVVLGWLIDTIAGTIELPPHRLERLLELLDAFPHSRRTCPKRELFKLLGELRSMILAIPGGVGCLSWIQEHVKQAGDRVYLNKHFHDALDDFRWLAKDVGGRPTRLGEIVPEVPLFTGTSDASGRGAGGVWPFFVNFINVI